jgi:simple sugar transport system permease protein
MSVHLQASIRRRLAGPLVGLSASLLAIVLALAVSIVVIALFGTDPQAAARSLWQGAFGSRQQFAATLVYVTPLSLVALGWIVVVAVGRVSIGFDGQIVMAGVAATWVGVNFTSWPSAAHLALAVALAVVAGALWAGIAAYLWAARGVNEIISTLLLNFVAARVLGWMIRGPLQEPTGGFAQSSPIEPSAKWPNLLSGTTLTCSFLLAVVLVIAARPFLQTTRFGYQMRLTGANDEVARRVGISTRRVTVLALILSGALAGIAGSSLMLGGQSGVLTDGFNQELGFYGIIVALLARNSPWGVLPAALLIAALLQGGPFMQAQVGVSAALVALTQGLVVVFVAGSTFIRWKAPADADGPAAGPGAGSRSRSPIGAES